MCQIRCRVTNRGLQIAGKLSLLEDLKSSDTFTDISLMTVDKFLYFLDMWKFPGLNSKYIHVCKAKSYEFKIRQNCKDIPIVRAIRMKIWQIRG